MTAEDKSKHVKRIKVKKSPLHSSDSSKLKLKLKTPRNHNTDKSCHQTLLPRMNDFGAVAATSTTSPSYLTEQARIHRWQSLPGFTFRVPFLTHDEPARFASAFGLRGDCPKVGYKSLIFFFDGFFQWMRAHEYAYCTEPNSKAAFYAFGRLESYNIFTQRRWTVSRVVASALAIIDVPFFVKIVGGFVEARGTAHTEDALEATVDGPATADSAELASRTNPQYP
jgi:hypothetical protein